MIYLKIIAAMDTRHPYLKTLLNPGLLTNQCVSSHLIRISGPQADHRCEIPYSKYPRLAWRNTQIWRDMDINVGKML